MRALAMLRRKHFAVLWLGLCLSCVGDYFYFLAVMWTAAKLAGSAAGLVAACQSGAALAVAPFAGLLADRLDRRHAMISADLGRAAAVGVLAVLAAQRQLTLPPMIMVALVLGTLDALFTPALLASIPVLVARPDELQAANGLVDGTRRLARAVGPSLAGAVAVVVSAEGFFTIDALSFCASAIAVFVIGPRFAWREAALARRSAASVPRDLREAIRLVGAHPGVSWSLVVLLVTNLTWCAGFQVGGVLLASRVLGTGIAGYGLLVGAYGVGNVAGNLLVSSVHVKRHLLAVFAGKLVLAAGFLVLAVAPSLPVAMAGAAIAAIGGPLGELPMIAMLQTEFSSSQRGRIFGLYIMTQHAGVAAGLVLAAPFFAVVPVRGGIALCALALAAAGFAGIARFGVRT
jgi:MFS family permease